MGCVDIPPDPIGPGKLKASVVLEGDEISVLNARLQAALQHILSNPNVLPGAFRVIAPTGQTGNHVTMQALNLVLPQSQLREACSTLRQH